MTILCIPGDHKHLSWTILYNPALNKPLPLTTPLSYTNILLKGIKLTFVDGPWSYHYIIFF